MRFNKKNRPINLPSDGCIGSIESSYKRLTFEEWAKFPYINGAEIRVLTNDEFHQEQRDGT